MGAMPGYAIVQRGRDQVGAGVGAGDGAEAAAGAEAEAKAVRGHNLLHSVVILRRCWMSYMAKHTQPVPHTHTHTRVSILENFPVWHSLNKITLACRNCQRQFDAFVKYCS